MNVVSVCVRVHMAVVVSLDALNHDREKTLFVSYNECFSDHDRGASKTCGGRMLQCLMEEELQRFSAVERGNSRIFTVWSELLDDPVITV